MDENDQDSVLLEADYASSAQEFRDRLSKVVDQDRAIALLEYLDYAARQDWTWHQIRYDLSKNIKEILS